MKKFLALILTLGSGYGIYLAFTYTSEGTKTEIIISTTDSSKNISVVDTVKKDTIVK